MCRQGPLQPTLTMTPTAPTCRSHSSCFWAAARSPSTGPETSRSAASWRRPARRSDGISDHCAEEDRLKLAEDLEGAVQDVNLRLPPHVEDPEQVVLVGDVVGAANLVRRHIKTGNFGNRT